MALPRSNFSQRRLVRPCNTAGQTLAPQPFPPSPSPTASTEILSYPNVDLSPAEICALISAAILSASFRLALDVTP